MISLVVTAVIAAFSCQVDAPQSVSIVEGTAKANAIGLPAASLKFSLSISAGDPMIAKVEWPGDPMQVAGEVPAISTGPGAYGFSAYSPGPCLFTEKECLTQVNVVETEDGKAQIILAPIAIARDSNSNRRNPFAVLAAGRCIRTDQTK